MVTPHEVRASAGTDATRAAGARDATGHPAQVREAAASVLGRDGVVAAALFLLIGYLVLGRSFAQIGIPAASIFLGEVIIAAMLIVEPTRSMFKRSVGWLVRPGPLHVQTWAVVLFIGFGVVLAVGGVLAGYNPLEAGKNLAFNYYTVMMVGGLAIAHRDPDALRRLSVALPWINAVYVMVFMLVLRNVQIGLPFSAVETLTPGAGTVVSLALIVCYSPSPGRRWVVIGLNLFCLLFLQVRGDWLAVVLGVGLWATLTRRWRTIAAGAAMGVVGLVLIAALGITIPGAADRGGAVSADQLFARAVAPIDPELAGRFSDDVGNFAGTTEWRQRWWGEIWKEANTSDARLLFGHGYGFDLKSVAEFLSGEDATIRTPHSIFFYTLGFSGWLGVLVFATLHGIVLAALIRVYRLTGNPFGVVLWVMATTSAMFGNFFETPYNSAPYWFLIGLVLAPLLAPSDDLRRSASRGDPLTRPRR